MRTYYKVVRIQQASDNPNKSWEQEITLDNGQKQTDSYESAKQMADQLTHFNSDPFLRYTVREFGF
jgi:hypothetical protein